ARWIYDRFINPRRSRDHAARVKLFQKLIAGGDLCFDVGANIGDYSAALLEVGAQVVAIEPQPSCTRELRARFSDHTRLTIEPIALGSAERVDKFYVHRDHGTSSLIADWETNECVEELHVQVRTIESLIGKYGIPKYIKIDVEGYELQVILGLKSKIDLI